MVVLTPDTRAWSRDLAKEATRLAETRFTQQTTLITEWTGQKDRLEQTPRARSNNKHCKVHLQSAVTTHFSPVTSSRSSESSLSISLYTCLYLYIYMCVYYVNEQHGQCKQMSARAVSKCFELDDPSARLYIRCSQHGRQLCL